MHLDWSHTAAALLPPPNRHISLVERKEYAVFGAGYIEQGAFHQTEIAMKLPVTVAGALMPDAYSPQSNCLSLRVGGRVSLETVVFIARKASRLWREAFFIGQLR